MAPWKSGVHSSCEGEPVIDLESWYGNGTSKRLEEGFSRSFSGYGRKPCVHSTCDCDLRELLRMPLRNQGYCGVGRGVSGLHWVWCSERGTHLDLRQEPQGSSPFLTRTTGSLQS